MYRPVSLALSLALGLGFIATVTAQSNLPAPGTGGEGSASNPIEAVITGPDDVRLGSTVILDASASRLVRENVSYRWYVNDFRQPVSSRGEMLYTPDRPGIYTFTLVITSNVEGELRQSQTTRTVTVYTRKILLITDVSSADETLKPYMQAAIDRGEELEVLTAAPASLPLSSEDILASLIIREKDSFRGAEAVVLWTQEEIAGLQALVRAVRSDPDGGMDLSQKTLVVISEYASWLARIARGTLSILNPKQILITVPQALEALAHTPSMEAFLSQTKLKNTEVVVLNTTTVQFHPWDLLSRLASEMLTHGVDVQIVLLLLMLPIIATIFAFLKQMVGITSFGLYTPSIITLSFLALGWKVGLFFLVFILLAGTLTREFMRRWRLLYIPKVAIIITTVSATLLVLIAIGALAGVTLARDTVFILLIMSTLAENLVNVKLEEGLGSAILGIGETIGGALLCVVLVRWPAFQSLILAYPELVLLTIPLNIFLGRWTGLRLVEYFRFREVFRHLQEE